MTRFSALLAAALVAAAAAPVAAQTAAHERLQPVDLHEADLHLAIRQVAQLTGATFIVDQGLQGAVSLNSVGEVSRQELLSLFFDALRAQGIVVARSVGGAYRLSSAAPQVQVSSFVGPGGVRRL